MATGTYTLVLANEHITIEMDGPLSIQQALDNYRTAHGANLTNARVQFRGVQVDPAAWGSTQIQPNDVLVVLTGRVASGGFKGA